MFVRMKVAAFAASRHLYPSRIEEKLALSLLAGAFALMLAQTAFAHDVKIDAIALEHPWSRATPSCAKVAGGYVEISNEGSSEDCRIAAIAGKTEIHEMAIKDGVMTMRPVPDGIPALGKGEVALKPGAYHQMFMELRQGEEFAGTLTFEKASTVAVKFAAEGMGATDPAHSSHSRMPMAQ